MGTICETNSNQTKHSYHYNHSNQNKHKEMNSLEVSNQKFPDMPLWNNGKKVGYGIKEMPAYKCDLKIDQLKIKRNEFWNSHKNHSKQWNIIHQACIYPHIKAEEYLAMHRFRTLDGCINMLVDMEGNIYRIPNYCINEPYFEKQLLPKNGGNSKNQLTIVLFDVINNKKVKYVVNENTTGEEIINLYSKQKRIDLKKYTIRLLYGGGLIRNNETLYQHKVKNGQMIQISISKKF